MFCSIVRFYDETCCCNIFCENFSSFFKALINKFSNAKKLVYVSVSELRVNKIYNITCCRHFFKSNISLLWQKNWNQFQKIVSSLFEISKKSLSLQFSFSVSYFDIVFLLVLIWFQKLLQLSCLVKKLAIFVVAVKQPQTKSNISN